MMQDEQVLAAVTSWLKEVVIGHNFCPFAGPVWQQQNVRLSVSSAASEEAVLNDLLLQIRALEGDKQVETTLLIVPHLFAQFADFNQFLQSADELLNLLQLEGVFQIASFHPDYTFAGVAIDDATNYTNRAPYPILHVLREASVEKAVAQYPQVDEIPARNIAHIEQLSDSDLHRLKSFSNSSIGSTRK